MDKKIGIMTFYNTTNYGALLQMLALYRSVREINDNSDIIRYVCPAVEERENLQFTKCRSMKQLARTMILRVPNGNKQKTFRKFEEKNFTFSNYQYDQESLKSISKEYNAVIVGSDQIWNTNLTGGDSGFYLPGVEGIRKCSYAGSFGSAELDKAEYRKIRGYLKDFDVISVREKTGINIVYNCIGEKPEFVMDPTFLLTADEWKKEVNLNIKTRKPYILLYLIQNKKKTISYAKTIAKRRGWSIKYVNISPYHVSGVENIRSASPEEFLNLINGASLVITGSYHGLALAVNFCKPVYYELHEGENNFNTRIESLIEVLGLQACKLDYSSKSLPNIDYEAVQNRLKIQRLHSKEVLRIIVNGAR